MNELAWSNDAKVLLDFLYRSWSDWRRPPSLAEIFDATDMDMVRVRRTYRDLQAGFALAFTDDTLNIGLLKVTPFSATPTPVYFEHEGRFHSFVGCPAEAITVSAMPAFAESTITVKSYCACCYKPITLRLRNMEIEDAGPVEPVVTLLGSPYEWENGVSPDRVCDNIHFALDNDHAERYQEQVARRGIVATLAQLQTVARPIGRSRMWDPDWPPMRSTGEGMVRAFAATGIDVSAWVRTGGVSSEPEVLASGPRQ